MIEATSAGAILFRDTRGRREYLLLKSRPGDWEFPKGGVEGEEELQQMGQPLEAEALIEGIKLHLNDEVQVHRGRTRLRESADGNPQLGAPLELNDLNPDRPLDGLGEIVADSQPEADD